MRKLLGFQSVALSNPDFDVFLNEIHDGRKNFVFGARDSDNGIVGVFMLDKVDARHKRAFWHVAFDKDHREHTKEFTKLFFDYIFIENGFRQLNCLVPNFNEAMKKFASKLGFKQNCILKDYFLLEKGWEDAVMYSLLKEKRKV